MRPEAAVLNEILFGRGIWPAFFVLLYQAGGANSTRGGPFPCCSFTIRFHQVGGLPIQFSKRLDATISAHY